MEEETFPRTFYRCSSMPSICDSDQNSPVWPVSPANPRKTGVDLQVIQAHHWHFLDDTFAPSPAYISSDFPKNDLKSYLEPSPFPAANVAVTTASNTMTTLSPRSSLSSSSLTSMTLSTTSGLSYSNSFKRPKRSSLKIPRRNHTISKIEYDSAAYNKNVSFDERQEAGAFDFLKLNGKRRAESFGDVVEQLNQNQGGSPEGFATRLKLLLSPRTSKKTTEHTTRRRKSEGETDHVHFMPETLNVREKLKAVDSLSRSKSHSDLQRPTVLELKTSPEDEQQQQPRSKSMKEERPSEIRALLKVSKNQVKQNRLSWTTQSAACEAKFSGSATSLISDGHVSRANTPTLSPTSSVIDISVKDLTSKDGCKCGYLSIKKLSGLKVKRYWCVLDGHRLYICAKDTKHVKQVVNLTTEHSVTRLEDSGGNSVRKKVGGGRQFELVPPNRNGSKRLAFVANTSEEAGDWIDQIDKVIKAIKRSSVLERLALDDNDGGILVRRDSWHSISSNKSPRNSETLFDLMFKEPAKPDLIRRLSR